METPLISVVIVNYNRVDDLRAAICSVQSQNYPNVEIIVVDNASTDGSARMLEMEFPQVSRIALSRNIGMDGYSVACREAKGAIIFQMDNDSLMPDNAVLAKIAAAFYQVSPQVAIIATRVEEFRNGRDDVEILRQRDLRHGPIETEGYHSGGVGFRRALLDKVGYYNEEVFLYGAELFVQMAVISAGFKLLFYPDILMLHKSSATARSPQSVYYETRNRYWLVRCYGTRCQQIRLLLQMLCHDFIYSVHKAAFRKWVRAVKDGIGKLPMSLAVSRRTTSSAGALARIGACYAPSICLERIAFRVRKKERLGTSAVVKPDPIAE